MFLLVDILFNSQFSILNSKLLWPYFGISHHHCKSGQAYLHSGPSGCLLSWARCTGSLIPAEDYARTQQQVIDLINSGDHTPGHNILLRKSGNALLAMCNYSGNSQGALVGEITDLNGKIDQQCGPQTHRTGFWHIGGPNKTHWRDVAGAQICCNCRGCSYNC
jgi:hypothetical protein